MDKIIKEREGIIDNLLKVQNMAIKKLSSDPFEDLVHTNISILIKEFYDVFDKLALIFKESKHYLPFIAKIIQFYKKDIAKPMLGALEYIDTYTGKNSAQILHPKILLFVN